MVTTPSNLARVAASRRSSVALRPCCDLDEQSLVPPRTVNDNNNDNNNDDEQALPGPVLSWQCCRMASFATFATPSRALRLRAFDRKAHKEDRSKGRREKQSAIGNCTAILFSAIFRTKANPS
jgi:hypothetical protein